MSIEEQYEAHKQAGIDALEDYAGSLYESRESYREDFAVEAILDAIGLRELLAVAEAARRFRMGSEDYAAYSALRDALVALDAKQAHR